MIHVYCSISACIYITTIGRSPRQPSSLSPQGGPRRCSASFCRQHILTFDSSFQVALVISTPWLVDSSSTLADASSNRVYGGSITGNDLLGAPSMDYFGLSMPFLTTSSTSTTRAMSAGILGTVTINLSSRLSTTRHLSPWQHSTTMEPTSRWTS